MKTVKEVGLQRVVYRSHVRKIAEIKSVHYIHTSLKTLNELMKFHSNGLDCHGRALPDQLHAICRRNYMPDTVAFLHCQDSRASRSLSALQVPSGQDRFIGY